MTFADPEEITAVKGEDAIVVAIRRFMIDQSWWRWEKFIHIGYFVFHIDEWILLKGIEDPVKGKARTNCITIGIDMRGNQKSFTIVDYVFNLLEHGYPFLVFPLFGQLFQRCYQE